MKRQKKVFNFADRKEAMELMKQLYGNDEVKDDQNSNTERESGTKSVGEMAELPPNCS